MARPRKYRTDADRMREVRRAQRDIGEIPEVSNAARRDSCARDLQLFCHTYLPHVFAWPFSADHERVIRIIQRCVLDGGLFCEAVFRGFGKTSLAEAAYLWAALYGHHQLLPVIASDQGAAQNILDSLRAELETNDLLYADFPTVCHPVRELEGIPHRCAGQLWTDPATGEQKPTHIVWRGDKVVLPAIPGPACEAVFLARGLTGRLRGIKHKRTDGTIVRPSFVLIDDPQTDDSARSLTQCDSREKLVQGTILGLAGHNKRMSAVMTCTVITAGDLADRFLDNQRHPEWQSERVPLVRTWPEDHAAWAEYQRLRRDYQEDDEKGRADAEARAEAHYLANREAMDRGALVSWEHCYEAGEHSAIQHAYNKLTDMGDDVFASEYQQKPRDPMDDGQSRLTAAQVCARASGRQPWVIPTSATHVALGIDIGTVSRLTWVLAAAGDGFTGAVVAYGRYPHTSQTLAAVTGQATERGQIIAAIEAVVRNAQSRDLLREDGARLTLGCVLVDSGWGQHADTVYEACAGVSRRVGLRCLPSRGDPVRVGGRPFNSTPKRMGEQRGWNWLLRPLERRSDVRLCVIETNRWKSFVHDRYLQGEHDQGAWSLFGPASAAHREYADEVTAESSQRVVDEKLGEMAIWRLKPGRTDNHYLDATALAAVALSIQGCTLEGQAAKTAPRPKQSLAQAMQRYRREN